MGYVVRLLQNAKMFGECLIVNYNVFIRNELADGWNVIRIILTKGVAFAFTEYNFSEMFAFLEPLELLEVWKLVSREVDLLKFVGVFNWCEALKGREVIIGGVDVKEISALFDSL